MRASRLVSVLRLLQARGQLTAAGLAQELGVSIGPESLRSQMIATAAALSDLYAARQPAGARH